MHENREISWASRPDEDRDRPAKAKNHNAGAHAPEKPDRAVVPMNKPNKGEVVPAEAGEGRARTKENIGRSNTSPPQSGERVSQGLSGVRQAARDKEAGTAHRIAPPRDGQFAPGQLLRSEAASCRRQA